LRRRGRRRVLSYFLERLKKVEVVVVRCVVC